MPTPKSLSFLEEAAEVRDADFLDGVPINDFISELPALQQEVAVLGFPVGGNNVCVTRGVVSRIDMHAYSSHSRLLVIQIDAAINPGNSGQSCSYDPTEGRSACMINL